MRRHLVVLGVIWVALTVAGVLLVQAPYLPVVASDKGEMIDETFRLLMLMSVPVFTFVTVMLGYSIIVFRHRGQPDEDGAPITGRGPIPLAWFIVTSLMAVGIMVYPGLTELPKVVHLAESPDVIVKITGLQWAWKMEYPGEGVTTTKELVLPVDKTVGFEITGADVIHSVWIPAFRMRIDAVPNLTTYMSFTPTETGTFEENEGFRLQCSQLCGGEHATMRVPVRVVTDAEYAAWVAENATGGDGGPVEGAQKLEIAAQNPAGTTDYVFTKTTLEAVAGKPISITFDNQDQGILHNIAVTADADTLGSTALEPGPVVQVLNLNQGLAAGSYPFLCQAHPLTMKGTLEVK